MNPDVTPDIQRRTILKVSWRLLPLIVMSYLVAYIDRTNVSFAALTMNKDLGLSAYLYGWGAGIFFFGYALFEVPSNIVLQRIGARLWIARIMITWGIISGLMATATGPTSFLVLRFLLGVAEAGFFPGIIFYLTLLVPGDLSRSRHLDSVYRRAGLERAGIGAIGRHSRDGRHMGSDRLAMDLHHRSHSGGAAGVCRLEMDDGATGGSRNGSTHEERNWLRKRTAGRDAARSRAPACEPASVIHRSARAGLVAHLFHQRHGQLWHHFLHAADHQRSGTSPT